MASIGNALDDNLIAALLLQGLPNDYKPMKMAMKMAMKNSGIELTTDYVKTKLLQEEYLPTNGDSYGTGEVPTYRNTGQDLMKMVSVMQRAEEDVSTQRSLNSTRYFKGPCSICN
jgi:hypothetical protein